LWFAVAVVVVVWRALTFGEGEESDECVVVAVEEVVSEANETSGTDTIGEGFFF